MPSDDELEYVEYERRGDVGIWRTDDVAALVESAEIAAAEQHYREHASGDAMDATVVAIDEVGDLRGELDDTLDHVNEQWSALADEVGVDRVAYVADGILGWTVQAKVDADVETSSFETVDAALDWVRE